MASVPKQRPKKKNSLPEGIVPRIVKEMLPPGVQVSKDVEGFLTECCHEFINMLSSESNEISRKEGMMGRNRLIQPKHVLSALEILGFEEYMGEVQAAYENYKTDMVKRKVAREVSYMTEEEAVAVQQRLFADARARMNSKGAPVPAAHATNSDDEEEGEEEEEEEAEEEATGSVS